MKVRICPKCKKHNPEDAWNCESCGETLSMKTVVDLGESASDRAAAEEKLKVSDISPFFHEDIEVLRTSVIRADEEIIWGCNLTQLSIRAPFVFGYVIITSRQVIAVYFDAEEKGPGSGLSSLFQRGMLAIVPKRAYIEIVNPGQLGARRSLGIIVESPKSPLMPEEKSSRKVSNFRLRDLESIKLHSLKDSEPVLESMIATFRDGSELTATFYYVDQAQKAYQLISAQLHA